MSMFRPIDKFYEKKGHVWVSPGITPICGSRKNPSAHPGLPVMDYNPETRSSYVMEQGTFVSVSEGHLIPATSIGFTATYDAQDVQSGVCNAAGHPVTAGSTFNFVATKPVGFVLWDLLQNPMTLPNDFQTHLTQTAPTIRTEGVIVLPVVYQTVGNTADETLVINGLYNFEVGDSVAPDFKALGDKVPTSRPGGIRKFLHTALVPTATTLGLTLTDLHADNIDHKVGRIIAVEHDYEFSTQGLNMVKSDGVDVQSDSTHGFPRHIWNAIKDSRLDATKKANFERKIVLVNINVK